MVICLERGADLHMAQLMPLPLTVSCSSKIQIGSTFLVLAHLGSPGKRAVKRVCVCYCFLPVRWYTRMVLVVALTIALYCSRRSVEMSAQIVLTWRLPSTSPALCYKEV